MAITRSQQAKQMLQDGGRIGLRFGSEGYQGGATNQGGAGRGTSVERGGGRDPSKQFVNPPTLTPTARETLKDQRTEARYQITPSTRPRNRIISGLLGAFIPGGGFLFNKAIDRSAMGFNTPTNIDDDDDTNTGGDRDGPIIPLIATPFQQDIVKDAIEELSPIELALKQRDEMGGARAFAKEGGIMDLETGRQMYLFGKLVKKIGRTVKKITKSPIGKAALLAAPLAFPSARAGLAKFLFKEPMKAGSGFSGFAKMIKGGLTGGGKLGIGAALTAAPLLFQKDDTEDEYQEFLNRTGRGPSIDIQGIRNDPYSVLARGFYADGGIMRLGFDDGDTDLSKDPNYKGWKKTYEVNPDAAEMNENHKRYLNFYNRNKNAQAEGSKEPVAKKTLPLLDMGGQEMDLRAEGGFVPIGRMEKADDVPARLSKNEFVFTADAVRNAGDGNVDKGAEVMYNMMKNLEAGGEVSEESQGLKGARKMFQTSQRLEEVL